MNEPLTQEEGKAQMELMLLLVEIAITESVLTVGSVVLEWPNLHDHFRGALGLGVNRKGNKTVEEAMETVNKIKK